MVQVSTKAAETNPNKAEAVDLSTAIVVVSYETTTNTGEALKLLSWRAGEFVDGRVELTGKIDQPIHIMISVQRGESEPLSLSAVAVPGGEEISFALLGFRTRASNQLSFLGSSRNVKDASKKFSY